ncbi:MAG: 50S ribosomal protein L3 [Candidatus Nanoarchaeia archaeon]
MAIHLKLAIAANINEMGHIKRKRPRRGSLGVWPRKRAKRIYPIVKNFAKKKEVKLLGFAGYKAGMLSVIVVDNRPKSPTKGEELKKAVTVVETPPLKVLSIRLYKATPYGVKVIGEVWADNLGKDLARKLNLPKKKKSTLEQLKTKLPHATEVRVIVHTQPRSTGLGKKTPEVFEIPIGGISAEEQFNYAVSILGKDIFITDVFKPGQYVDVHAVTKGKGFAGDIKRYGVKLASHKAEFGRRHRQTMGPITPAVTGWWVLQPGQMGFHKRTDYNKQIIKISNTRELNINPISGFSRYGLVKNNFILIDGSIPGPKKRLVILSHAIRPRKAHFEQAPDITHISLRSQQG